MPILIYMWMFEDILHLNVFQIKVLQVIVIVNHNALLTIVNSDDKIKLLSKALQKSN